MDERACPHVLLHAMIPAARAIEQIQHKQLNACKRIREFKTVLQEAPPAKSVPQLPPRDAHIRADSQCKAWRLRRLQEN